MQRERCEGAHGTGRRALAAWLLLAAGTSVACGDEVDRFFVDGLAVDTLEERHEEEGAFFEGKLPGLSIAEYIDLRRAGKPVSPFASFRPTEPMSSEATERMRAAEVHIAERSWDDALVEVQAALEQDPLNMYIVRRAATLAAMTRNYEVADTYFERYINTNPYDMDYVVAWAGVLIRMGRFDEAQGLVGRALSAKPSDLAARFNQVCLHVTRGNWDQAKHAWGDQDAGAIELAANWLDADRPQLVAALGEEGFRLVTTAILGAVEIDNLPRIAHHLREARDARRAERREEAEEAYREVLSLGVENARIEMQVVRMSFQSGDHEFAFSIAKRLALAHPEDEAIWYDYGYVCLKMERPGDSIVAFERAHRLAPDLAHVTFALACAYAADGSIDQAWPLLEEVADNAGSLLPRLLEGEDDYLTLIHGDPRFPELMSRAEQ